VNQTLKKLGKRDSRLLLALLLFAISAGAMLVQAGIFLLYFRSAAERNWAKFLEIFPSYALPPLPPGVGCFDDCYPDLPFVAGTIGLVCFFFGMAVLAYSWWMPKWGLRPNHS
jgi:hypothetical protein